MTLSKFKKLKYNECKCHYLCIYFDCNLELFLDQLVIIEIVTYFVYVLKNEQLTFLTARFLKWATSTFLTEDAIMSQIPELSTSNVRWNRVHFDDISNISFYQSIL